MLLMPFQAALGDTSSHKCVPDSLDKLLGRYWSRFRTRLKSFAAASERHADLLSSFPAAAVEIVSRGTGDNARATALALVERGAPLTLIAAALDVPYWMRKLPPECFSQPLPEQRASVLHDPNLSSRLLNTLPMSAMRPDRWLQSVMSAAYLGGSELAVWVGAQRIFNSRRVPQLPLLPLALYHAFSLHPDLAVTRLMHRSWEPKMSLGRASNLTRHWLLRVLQDCCIDNRQINPWTSLGRVGGLDIVPLTTSAELTAEGAAMQSCVGSYAAYVVFGECRLYSIRRNGERLATMEVRSCPGSGMPHINQIKGPRNAPPPAEAAATATAWLDERVASDPNGASFGSTPHSEALFRTQIWEPFAGWRGFAVHPAPRVTVMVSALRDLLIIEHV